jgi:hypothetical protein
MYILRILVTLFFVIITQQVNSQEALSTVALGGFELKKILADFENTSNRLINTASTNASGLASKFGNELNIGLQNANYYFSGQEKRAFNDLNTNEQNVFVELNKIIESFNRTRSDISTISELANLDLIGLTNRIDLLTKNRILY